MERGAAGGVLAVLVNFLRDHSIGLVDVEALFVQMGTGSFTATRTVATMANMLALAQNLRVVALENFANENPEILLARAGGNRYILPTYSAPPRIGSS